MTKYIKQIDGSFTVVDESSELFSALSEIELKRRPVFFDEFDQEVLDWKLNQRKRQSLSDVLTFSTKIREGIAKSRHYLQASRWAVQLASAKAIKAGTPIPFDTSIMAREARLRARGESVEQLADKVIANSLAFASVGAAVDGIETATLDAIQAYTGNDPTAFDAILANAKATALAEFLDIFTPAYGQAQAQAMATQFFGS